MTNKTKDLFGARAKFDTGSGSAYFYRLQKLEEDGLGAVSRLPFSIKVLLEAVLRECDEYVVTRDDVSHLAAWNAREPLYSCAVVWPPGSLEALRARSGRSGRPS